MSLSNTYFPNADRPNTYLRNLAHSLLLITLLGLMASQLYASPVALEKRYVRFEDNIQVHADLSIERITEFEIKALQERALQQLKTYRFSYSSSIEELDVLEAYTHKADGRKIRVPKDNYQITTNTGNKGGNQAFSDRTTLQIIFPDLELGDAIVARLKRKEKEPMFPDNFSLLSYFYSEEAYDNVAVNIKIPEDIAFHHQVRNMALHKQHRNGFQILQLRYSNPRPAELIRSDFSVWSWQQESGFALSSFNNYQEIAQAYGRRAAPRAKVNDRIKNLTEIIIGDETDPYQRAKLLYNWVATQISYAGNCIGVGAVVPRHTDFILDNKMGDCKDHATLLEALLTSAGLKSSQALINSGSIYHLPEIAMVSSVNHVINYLPDFDLFIDATNPTMPFGHLSFSLQDKPVLLVENFIEGLRTPAMQADNNSQALTASMTIHTDGAISGDTSVTLTGLPAIEARNIWRNTTEKNEALWLQRMFSANTQKGSATVTKDDPKPLLSTFSYSFNFNRPEFVLTESTGGFWLGALGYSPQSIFGLLTLPENDIDGHEVACGNGQSQETLSYHFPNNMKVIAAPSNFSLTENHLAFTATYHLNGQQLKVSREIIDSTPGNICSPALINAQKTTLTKILKHLKSQLIYQMLEP